MRSLWFIVPVHGRLSLARICLKQLRRTCDALQTEGVHATAVVIADPENHAHLGGLLDELQFGRVIRDNEILSRRFNDGIQLATDPAFNPHPADYVVPIGSDDWVDHRLFLDLPPENTVVGFQRMSFVREDGRELVTVNLDYLGGAGIRIIPRHLVATLDYPHRPGDEDRKRACDTSILTNLRLHHKDKMRVEHRHLHDHQIVDWKTPVQQLNTFSDVIRPRRPSAPLDPFETLAGVYPDEALDEMAAHYQVMRRRGRVAA